MLAHARYLSPLPPLFLYKSSATAPLPAPHPLPMLTDQITRRRLCRAEWGDRSSPPLCGTGFLLSPRSRVPGLGTVPPRRSGSRWPGSRARGSRSAGPVGLGCPREPRRPLRAEALLRPLKARVSPGERSLRKQGTVVRREQDGAILVSCRLCSPPGPASPHPNPSPLPTCNKLGVFRCHLACHRPPARQSDLLWEKCLFRLLPCNSVGGEGAALSVCAACKGPATRCRDPSSLSLGPQVWLMSWEHLYIYFSFS